MYSATEESVVLLGGNFSVEEHENGCYAELKISCKVFDVAMLRQGVRCGMGLYDWVMCMVCTSLVV